MTILATLAAVLFALTLAALLLPRVIGFRAQRAADYRATPGPAFDLRLHLSGPLQCEGVIFGPLGRVSSRFVARMHGRWQGSDGILTEDFRYDSDESQHREWQLHLAPDGAIQARAADLVGLGTGHQTGDAVHLKYRIRLPARAGGHVLSVTDWMYLAPDGTIINRSQFTKFGIKVAELVATMRRVPQ